MAKRKGKAARSNRGQFKPGQSGNPGGRPKTLPELRLAARAHTPEALSTLAAIMRSRRATPGARVQAVRELLDRAWGRPAQELEVHGSMVSVSVPGKTFDELTGAERMQLAQRIAYMLRAGAEGREMGARDR